MGRVGGVKLVLWLDRDGEGSGVGETGLISAGSLGDVYGIIMTGT